MKCCIRSSHTEITNIVAYIVADSFMFPPYMISKYDFSLCSWNLIGQSEPVSIEQTDVENFVEEALRKKSGKLCCDAGAMSLYHPEDLPFNVKERPESYGALYFFSTPAG